MIGCLIIHCFSSWVKFAGLYPWIESSVTLVGRIKIKADMMINPEIMKRRGMDRPVCGDVVSSSWLFRFLFLDIIGNHNFLKIYWRVYLFTWWWNFVKPNWLLMIIWCSFSTIRDTGSSYMPKISTYVVISHPLWRVGTFLEVLRSQTGLPSQEFRTPWLKVRLLREFPVIKKALPRYVFRTHDQKYIPSLLIECQPRHLHKLWSENLLEYD